jgi:hypothetical protein
MSRVLWFVTFAACTAEPGDTTPVADPVPGDPDYVRDPALDVALDSIAGSDDSHETGEACMHCHQPHGDGPGVFTAAGSVYRSDGTPANAGTIELWAGGLDVGARVVVMEVDALGNFYTTADLGLPDDPVQPVVVDPDGEVVNLMPWTTESASCNQCHTPVKRITMP